MSDNHPKIYLYKRIVQAKLFIDSHFAEAIDLDAIADEAYFSKFHFIRLFKTIYGKTPHQYLTRVRIEKAKELLQQNLTIADVCMLVGFDSVSSFTSLFKRCVKVTPSVYQQSHLERQRQILRAPLQFVPNCFVHHIVPLAMEQRAC